MFSVFLETCKHELLRALEAEIKLNNCFLYVVTAGTSWPKSLNLT